MINEKTIGAAVALLLTSVTSSYGATALTFEFNEFTAFNGFTSGSPATTGGVNYVLLETGGNGINAAADSSGNFGDDGGFLFTGPPAVGINGIIQLEDNGTTVPFVLGSIDLRARSGTFTVEGLDASGAVIFTLSDTALAVGDTQDFETYTNAVSTPVMSLRFSSTVSTNENRFDSLALNACPVPEPSSALLLGVASLGLMGRRLRK